MRQEYEKAVDPDLVSFVEKARATSGDGANKMGYEVSAVGERQRTDERNLLGEEINADVNYFKGDRVHHIDIRHGKSVEADNSMADVNDIARMGYVLDNYDKRERKRSGQGRKRSGKRRKRHGYRKRKRNRQRTKKHLQKR